MDFEFDAEDPPIGNVILAGRAHWPIIFEGCILMSSSMILWRRKIEIVMDQCKAPLDWPSLHVFPLGESL